MWTAVFSGVIRRFVYPTAFTVDPPSYGRYVQIQNEKRISRQKRDVWGWWLTLTFEDTKLQDEMTMIGCVRRLTRGKDIRKCSLCRV